MATLDQWELNYFSISANLDAEVTFQMLMIEPGTLSEVHSSGSQTRLPQSSSKTTWELVGNENAQPRPGCSESQALGMRSRNPCYTEPSMVFQCMIKFENHWSPGKQEPANLGSGSKQNWVTEYSGKSFGDGYGLQAAEGSQLTCQVCAQFCQRKQKHLCFYTYDFLDRQPKMHF